MNSNWATKNITKKSVEHIRVNYDDILKSCDAFIIDSQFNDSFGSVDDLPKPDVFGYPKIIKEAPKELKIGTILLGVNKDKSLIELRAVFDTSD